MFLKTLVYTGDLRVFSIFSFFHFSLLNGWLGRYNGQERANFCTVFKKWEGGVFYAVIKKNEFFFVFHTVFSCRSLTPFAFDF